VIQVETFKDDKGENHTAPVMGKAAEKFRPFGGVSQVT
jgi:hypothetical protein